MKTILLAVVACLLWQGQKQDSAKKAAKRPVDVFRELDGKWRGTFVGYDTAGKTLYRIAVEQVYRTESATRQSVRMRDRMQDGKVITGKGANTAIRDKDGSVRLRCQVQKSNGERVVHDGRLTRGPSGQKEIVWYSKSKDRVETFREWVTGKGKNAVYHIHGMGRYGDTSMLMAGEYRRVVE